MNIGTLNEIQKKLTPIHGFLKIHLDVGNHKARVSLKDDISFKAFSQFCPIPKKELVALFDLCDDNQHETYTAIHQLMQEDE